MADDKRNIIVIGASAGGFEVLKKIVSDLPPDLDASVFIVWHMSPDIRGILPEVLNKLNTIYAANAFDGEPIKPNRIYVAPPDRHMVIQKDVVRVTHGPKENRFRPAIDPLFRSAAYAYGDRVIGVVLSGALDDGTAGLWKIKSSGGVAVVQDPADAQFSSMPASALKEVAVDHVVNADEVAALLARLCTTQTSQLKDHFMEEDENAKREIDIVLQNENSLQSGVPQFGELTPYTCPDCHGVLSSIKEGMRVRYRCHTGHAFSADTLLQALTENIEQSMWSAIRGMEESVLFLNHVGDHLAGSNKPKVAALYFQKANEVLERIKILRGAVADHEHLNTESIDRKAESWD